MVYCLLIFYKRPRKPRLAIDWQILQAGNEFWTQQILEKLPSQRFVVSIMAQVYPFQINRVFSNMAEKWKKLDESLNLRDAGTACWWLWLAEIIDPVSLCWHISRAAWKKRGKKDAKRDERSWLRKDSQTNQVCRQLCEMTKHFSNVVASLNSQG